MNLKVIFEGPFRVFRFQDFAFKTEEIKIQQGLRIFKALKNPDR